MNNYMNNEKDLQKIFDKRWTVNNETSKNVSDKVNSFREKLYDNDNSVSSQVNRLNQRIDNIKNNQRDKFIK